MQCLKFAVAAFGTIFGVRVGQRSIREALEMIYIYTYMICMIYLVQKNKKIKEGTF
jgi:hypothetical protein